MKKTIIAVSLVFALALSGCASLSLSAQTTQKSASGSASQTPMTQAIAQDDDTNVVGTSQNTASNTAAATTATTGEQDLLAQYISIKAERDALDIDEEKLEANYRVGKVDETSFRQQRQELEAQDDELERQEEDLERQLERQWRDSTTLPQGTVDELLSQKRDVEAQSDDLEYQEDVLERDYRNDTITRDDFLTRQKEILQQLEELDWQEELLEEALERQGWDD